LRTRAIPERLRGVFTTRRYTNPRLPLPLPWRAPIWLNDPLTFRQQRTAVTQTGAGYEPATMSSTSPAV